MPLEASPLDEAALSAAVRKITSATAPPQLRLMAARGMAPLPPADLVVALYQFVAAPVGEAGDDAEVVNAARKTARELPDAILSGALGGPLDARVLDFFARAIMNRPKLLQIVLLNQAAADETFAHVAKTASEATTELIAQNERRLLRHPAIITSLYLNPKTRMSTATRAIELAVRNQIELDGIPSFSDVKAAIQSEGVPDPSGDSMFSDLVHAVPAGTNAAAIVAAQQADAAGPSSESDLGDGAASASDAEIAAVVQALDEKAEALLLSDAESAEGVSQIAKLSMSAKLRLATVGNAFARAVLIRDTNRVISMAAVRSPGMTEHEAERYAGNRALHEDVVRYIATQRQFTKRYSTKLNLVNNPKCPLQSAIVFLSHLTPKDLRGVGRSKGVPAALAKAAQGLIQKRESKQ